MEFAAPLPALTSPEKEATSNDLFYKYSVSGARH